MFSDGTESPKERCGQLYSVPRRLSRFSNYIRSEGASRTHVSQATKRKNTFFYHLTVSGGWSSRSSCIHCRITCNWRRSVINITVIQVGLALAGSPLSARKRGFVEHVDRCSPSLSGKLKRAFGSWDVNCGAAPEVHHLRGDPPRDDSVSARCAAPVR